MDPCRSRGRGLDGEDRVGLDRLDEVVDVHEGEAREQGVALVHISVADVDVVVGLELGAHLVEVVLAADEVGLHAVA